MDKSSAELDPDWLGRLGEVLYGDKLDGHLYHLIPVGDLYYLMAMGDDYPSPDNFIAHVRCLVEYLESGNSDKPIADFVPHIRKLQGWCRKDEREFNNVWSLLWHVIGHAMWIPILEPTFKKQIQHIYPLQSQKTKPTSFMFTIHDIQMAGLSIEPSSHKHEHLSIVGNTVKIYSPHFDGMWELDKFSRNRIARALDISSLGSEIFASLNALYGKDRLYDEAGALGLIPKSDRMRCDRMLQLMFGRHKEPPRVLASRVYTLEKLIKHRRSWWPSLKRDLQRSRTEQPFVFWGSIFAIFFGVSSVIQTAMSIWSVVLAIQAA